MPTYGVLTSSNHTITFQSHVGFKIELMYTIQSANYEARVNTQHKQRVSFIKAIEVHIGHKAYIKTLSELNQYITTRSSRRETKNK